MGRRIHHDEKMIPQEGNVIPNECEESKILLFERDKDFSVAKLLRNDKE
jgi:hypothetical protein